MSFVLRKLYIKNKLNMTWEEWVIGISLLLPWQLSYHSNEVCGWCLLSQVSTMPNMKLIWLKTKELQSYKVDFSWQSIVGPLVIQSTSYHRKDLFLSRLPLIIRSAPYHRRDLLSSKRPLLIESAKHHGPSCHRKHLLSSRVPLIIGKTS